MSKNQRELPMEQVEDISQKLNQVIIVETVRPNGTLRQQQDFSYCPTMAEQHTAHLTDINYLIKRYKPDELQAYIAARSQYRAEILGHDFSQEPSLQEAKNEVYRLKTNFNNLPDSIKNNFKNHVEFLKFIDNPANQEKMVQLGLLTKRQVKEVSTDPIQDDDKLKQESKKGHVKTPPPVEK